MQPKTIIFLGTKPIGYECFSNLVSRQSALNIVVAGLLTQSRKEFGERFDLTSLALEHNIPVFNSLDEIPECDIIYSVQYHKILKEEHIGKAKQIAVNLHMAPLPEYRGSNQFSFALLDQKTEFGTTIHKIDPMIDHGDILFQERFPIPDQCWVNELYQLTHVASVKLFIDSLQDIVNGRYHPIPQDDLIAGYGTSLHYRKEMADLKLIDLGWEKEKIERYIRATSMPGFEPSYCVVDGKKIPLNPA